VKLNRIPFKRVNQRKAYRALLFVFCVAILVQLLIVAPLSIDDQKGLDEEPASSTTLSQNEKSKIGSDIGEGADLDSKAHSNGVPPELAGDQKMKSVHMLETRDGEKDWELWSDVARSNPDSGQVELQGVNSLFHGNKGVTYSVKGRKGLIEVPKKDLKVSGNVVTKTSSGYVFLTDDMSYFSKNRVLQTDSLVRVLGPKSKGIHALKLTGKGLRTMLNDSKVEVLKDVRAEKILEKGQKAIIRSDRARFDGNSVTASFLGEVILDIDDMRITGPKADFLYDSTKDTLKSVVFSGGAKVSDPTKWATSKEVKVDFEEDKYVFSGNPRVVQNSDELHGEKIIFHDGGKRIQVIGAKAKMNMNRLKEEN
tara:strand:+ start:50772 stop:51872 length:1101 start_codon:yes stop_codon:yes gene_type:complete